MTDSIVSTTVVRLDAIRYNAASREFYGRYRHPGTGQERVDVLYRGVRPWAGPEGIPYFWVRGTALSDRDEHVEKLPHCYADAYDDPGIWKAVPPAPERQP